MSAEGEIAPPLIGGARAMKRVLPTVETQKEKQKALKQLKEERRATIATACCLDMPAVEDQVLTDDKWDKFELFFAGGPNNKTLIFFYQEVFRSATKSIFIADLKVHALEGMSMVFMRMGEKAISQSNVHTEVTFQCLDASGGKLFDALQLHMERLIIPSLENGEDLKKPSMQAGASTDFLETVKRFMSALKSAKDNMAESVELSVGEEKPLVDKLTTHAEMMAALNSSDVLGRFEKLLMNWCRQIERVLNEAEQIRREADDQMRNPQIQAVILILHKAKSKQIQKWRLLDNRITDAANEAKDNVKYLFDLDHFFGTLSRSTPCQMVEQIPNLINGIRMIYGVSHYYNTSERMTSLFVKITNQMITNCRLYIRDGITRIWDLPTRLNTEYQACFHKVQQKLREDPTEKQFEFSENYIFGKFDTFCRRLLKIHELIDNMTGFAELLDIKFEGIEPICAKIRSITDNVKKKNYDILDHRKPEFDNDYTDYMAQFEGVMTSIQAYLENWFERSNSVDKLLSVLQRFEEIKILKFDFGEKYSAILNNYAKELESVRRLYQKQKTNPPLARNFPPMSGKIMWSRHLFHKIEEPMKHLQKRCPKVLRSHEGQKVVRNYNNMATALIQYELLVFDIWKKHISRVHDGLTAPLLIRFNSGLSQIISSIGGEDMESGTAKAAPVTMVNFDNFIMETMAEAKQMITYSLAIPEFAQRLLQLESELIKTKRSLEEMLQDHVKTLDSIPQILKPLFVPFCKRVDQAMSPMFTVLSWTSSNTTETLHKVKEELTALKLLIKQCTDILNCRIEDVLEEIAETNLCNLPENEEVTLADFVSITELSVTDAQKQLALKSKLLEKDVNELLHVLKGQLTDSESVNLSADDNFECVGQDAKKHRCQDCLPCCYNALLSYYTQRNTEALVSCTRATFDNIKRRLYTSTSFVGDSGSSGHELSKKVPLFKSEFMLEIPNVVMQPNLDELQSGVNRAIHLILGMAKGIEPWKHMVLTHKLLQKELDRQNEQQPDDAKMNQPLVFKPLEKIISEHKEVTKIVIQLNTVMNSFKDDISRLLNEFSAYSELWQKDASAQVAEFMAENPILSEFNAKLRSFVDLEASISGIPNTHRVGALIFMADKLKAGLVEECHTWRQAFGKALNQRCASQMDEILEFFDSLMKRLLRPVKDLDDVRMHMAGLSELRDNEIRLDMTIGPIEESYALLNRYELYFNDGNAERVDSLTYGYSKLRQQSKSVQDHLIGIQPQFKNELVVGVEQFIMDVDNYTGEYDTKGPMVQGIPPREASDRLTIFQAKFDELWRKYVTYSGGEELFGLTITDYPELQRIKKELNLAQKLYQLYNNVLDTLPKALKEWPAFEDLRKTIDDFNETCPLMEMMANKAMMTRHWERLEKLTGHKFDVESDNFLLRNLMEAPLLKNKEDIEDICISAVKEKDIEAKLKTVINDWSAQDFQFGTFKNRGELLLKGDTTSEAVTLMEDSLMILGSLMSNRYNAPFKPKIQEWVHKLTSTTEIIESWLMVQNLWIYLEAVFVGGDIAKQLPQEAKRFANIDKSWQRIMQRAHEIPNIIQCCTGDDTLSQLLPHLLEQLELCQKSLTASDSHTIQNHLLSVFDNTKNVLFDEKVYDKITALVSQEGETVPLMSSVMAQGNVELWLGELLSGMRNSIHSIIKSAFFALNDASFKLIDFENAFPAQIGLLGIQLLWTRDAQEALNQARYDKKIMNTTNTYFLDILNELITITLTDLTKMDRTKFETLITIHVHQKDIFEDLVKLHVKSPKDFEWLKQSRFYFVEDDDKCLVSICDVDSIYQNEYLGCTDRLVITPLTDRCYITLSQALGMSLGGAPAGPAGTGKTETTKDMGRCLGKFVVVFNCSDQMDYRGLGRIYKGLAQSGSWGCFDEFNRIELPVLSVAAQQIAIVLTCKKERKTSFVFTDGDVNPGYAGRQELPENLKINFRTVAMMVPDRAIIMRVKLASCGFLKNQELSKKFFTLYKLCEEQLSKQVHYDFGLRNILSVLRTLGAFKRANPQDSEPMILMRVLRDMNLSKLVDEDEPLFMSLITDLFPGMTLSKKGYPELETAIKHQVEEIGLIYHPPWILKVIQLYETQRVRHGIMTLGPSGAGKSKCIQTLMRAMTECGEPHKEMRMNPKAITAPQMFGRLDVATNDWTDGIFSTLWRRTHKVKKGDFCWLILDGPVDAIWIENLNSVLDDNKTLTLANGDRIPMAPNCKILFEVHNIDNASPATVSRNGMIYMSSSILDWKPIFKGWLLTRSEGAAAIIYETMERFFGEAYRYVSQNLEPKMDLLECNFARQAIDMLEGLLLDVDEKEISKQHLQRLIVFAGMWSLGAPLESADRTKLQQFLFKIGGLPMPPVKEDDTMFEFVVSAGGEWEHWEKRVPVYEYPTDSVPEYTSILVPNVDNTRTDFLIHTIAKQSKPVLLIGEQGTAKTVIIKGYANKFDPELHIFKSLNFSSATTPNMFQRTVESYVDKRMGSTYGPPAGKKMTIFIDDINMPVINDWGDQITNEITRQMMEMNGFYNLDKPGEFTSLTDIQVLAAMIHPGGGRNDIPQRLKRQFNVFNCTLPSNASMDKVFNSLGLGHFCNERGFKAEVRACVSKLVPCTRRLWQRVKVKMLPTPAKFHYVFNLRDVSRIWQGMLNTNHDIICSVGRVMSLWRHECTRVIADRFTEQSDKDWFDKAIIQQGTEDCGQDAVSSMEVEPYFVDFLQEAPEVTGDEPEDADLEAPKIYEPIESFDSLKEKLGSYMQMYNEAIRGGKLDLVFFKDAMSHLVKISRIIRTPKGHALLVGVGGSGKQSLTRLASFIAGYSTFQITLTRSYNVGNLADDLKQLYRVAGGRGKGITFLFTDNEIKDEAFLEFINNMLSSGVIANLFSREEMDEILQELVSPMKREFPRRPPTNENLTEYYLSRVTQNLHVVLCFSPVGEKFRNRSLKFPGLISGCTMDWFQRWPKDALIAVADYFLSSFEIVCTPTVKKSMVDTMGVFHDLVAETCSDYFQRFRRQTHVTPKSYLSFIGGYKEIYSSKLKEIGLLADRMNTGLDKLVEATISVNKLSEELVVKEKELDVANKKAELVLAEVTSKASAAQKVKEQVQVVKDKAQVLVDAISADKAQAEGKLEAARPAMEEAEAALETIKPAHISTVRKLGKPPHLIMRIMDCVLILFQKRMDPVTPDPERPSPKPCWGEALKLMGNSAFLNGLLNFPKDSINDEMVELMEPYFNMEDFTMEKAKSVCGDVAGLCSWTKAMASFFSINKEVLPLKANLAVQENRLRVAMEELGEAQQTLDNKQKELDIVQAEYDAAMAEKQALLEDAEGCRRKMSNASALINGLSGEKTRWTEASLTFKQQINLLVGDVVLATAFLSYNGPFNQEFRSLLSSQWRKELVQRNIPFSDDLNIISMLVDNATLSDWSVQGLPSDELSIQNGLVVTRATRYPLLIDPQGQGKAWILKKEAKNDLQVTSLNNKYFRTHLEDALSLGRPLLLEDVNEELDPALDNVLEKNFIKSGSTFKVKVGDKECDLMNGFKLYITTKLPNPSYTPEVYAKTSIIDFTVTMRGLEDQLLGLVILTEKAELEAGRVQLMEEVAANKRKMQELEDNLLYRLTSTKGSLVEDESLIEMLNTTKITSEQVREKLSVAADTEIKINTAREEYRPVAARGSILYFLIVEMSMVNVMYQTALKQFLGIFDLSMAKATKSPLTQKRIGNIIETLTWETYAYTARGFYEVDKFTFTVLLTMKVAMHAREIRADEFQVFIKGGAALDLNAVEPKPKKWIQDMTWLNLVELSKLPYFTQITEHVTKNDKGWKNWYDTDAPEENPIPDGYEKLDTFRRLLLVRCWCPDRAIPMAKKYVAEAAGQKFADGVITNLDSMIVKKMHCLSPECGAISMGQGQEVHARRLLNVSMTEGRWILLQNCHLGLNFMDELLEIVTTTENVHESFRCWLTSEGHPKFPINLLQTSIKFTYDPPMGIRAGLRRTYALLTQDQLDINNLPQWKPMLYGVAFLHTTVQERRKFGPIGWNIPYEFNQADFSATVQFIQNHLDDIDPKKGISWPTVRYMIGEVQYGGRVTDDYDKRLLNTYARVWFLDAMFLDAFEFSKGYKIPKVKSLDEYRGKIDSLPLIDSPECFGLHANADITYQTNNANAMLTTIVNIQPKDSAGGGGETREDVVYRLADDMLSKLPSDYNPFEVSFCDCVFSILVGEEFAVSTGVVFLSISPVFSRSDDEPCLYEAHLRMKSHPHLMEVAEISQCAPVMHFCFFLDSLGPEFLSNFVYAVDCEADTFSTSAFCTGRELLSEIKVALTGTGAELLESFDMAKAVDCEAGVTSSIFASCTAPKLFAEFLVSLTGTKGLPLESFNLTKAVDCEAGVTSSIFASKLSAEILVSLTGTRGGVLELFEFKALLTCSLPSPLSDFVAIRKIEPSSLDLCLNSGLLL
ncbi:Dynein heavy chain 8, axonemal [Cichlidogyrus casuarinus]|uniref:Dynein heavy chain 8, axonemal n=1 Tax=Cichlidogyrus casuarinus TaxID=1844966 RepID=A0ABD2QLY9_9PLAT